MPHESQYFQIRLIEHYARHSSFHAQKSPISLARESSLMAVPSLSNLPGHREYLLVSLAYVVTKEALEARDPIP